MIVLKSSREQAKDTGMALAFLCLLLWVFTEQSVFPKLAAVLLLFDMIMPSLFKPFAVLWFGLAHVLGSVVSRLLLSLIFFVIVTPVGILRKIMGYDSLKLTAFKKQQCSVLTDRNQTYSARHIETPY
ncbi:hypothetical protein GF406_19020 [candidate division KSB1 bacterium]|nr:hypothetical protein [candidate division KSB1 bacterium]